MNKKAPYFIYILMIAIGALQMGCRQSAAPITPSCLDAAAPGCDPVDDGGDDTGGGEEDTSLVVLNDVAGSIVAPTTIKLSWTWSNSNYDAVASYEIQRRIVGYALYTSLATIDVVDGITPASYYNDATSGGDKVEYQIILHYEAEADAIYHVDAISYHPMMQNLVVTFLDYDQTKVTWDWSNTNFANLNYYLVLRKKNAEVTWTYTGSPIYSEPTEFIDATPGASTVTYRFELHYTDGDVVNVDTLSKYYDAPTVSGLTAAASDGAIDLNWSWLNATHADAIDYYEIQRKPTYYGAWASIATIDVPFGSSPATTYTDSSSGGVPVVYRIFINYHYSVDAYTFATVSVDLPDPLAAPTDFEILSYGSSASLQWDYSPTASNVDQFVIHTIVTDVDGIVKDTVSYANDFFSDFYGIATYNYYFYSLNTQTECMYTDGEFIQFKIQALPINEALASASAWVESDIIPCP